MGKNLNELLHQNASPIFIAYFLFPLKPHQKKYQKGTATNLPGIRYFVPYQRIK